MNNLSGKVDSLKAQALDLGLAPVEPPAGSTIVDTGGATFSLTSPSERVLGGAALAALALAVLLARWARA